MLFSFLILYWNFSFSLLGWIILFLNLIGLGISGILLSHTFNTQSNYVEAICSLFKQYHCNSVLDSKAAKFMGLVHWSEIGTSYFLANMLLLLFAPSLYPWLVWINIIVLPYSFWSVWYQKKVAMHWCMFCLGIQVILWLLFLSNLLLWTFVMPSFWWHDLMTVALIYGLPFCIVVSLVPVIVKALQSGYLQQEINSLKANDELFMALLKNQPCYKIDE